MGVKLYLFQICFYIYHTLADVIPNWQKEQHHMSNQNLIDVDNQVEEEVESEKMDDDQTIENPEVREVSTHEVV